jgi:hypothetical protein
VVPVQVPVQYIHCFATQVHGPNEDPFPIVDINSTFGEVVDYGRRTLAGEILAMDMAVKNITDSYQKAGLWKDTVLVFSVRLLLMSARCYPGAT